MNQLIAKLSEQVGRQLPRRIPLLYPVLGVLLLLSVVPLVIYGVLAGLESRDTLQTNEQVLQTTVTRSIAQEIGLHVRALNQQTQSLVRLLESTGAIENVGDERHADSLRRAVESFIRSAEEKAIFLTIVNSAQKGIAGGDPQVGQNDFVITQFGRAFQTAQLGHAFRSGAFLVERSGVGNVPVVVLGQPLAIGNNFRGMVAIVVSLEFLRTRLRETSTGGLVAYVVNGEGRLIIHPDEQEFTVGEDMNRIAIVQMFRAGTEQATTTTRFSMEVDGRDVEMLGTQAAVPELGWAVIAQKPIAAAYFAVREMERYAIFLALVVIVFCVVIGYVSARRLTTPLHELAATTRAIARGDFSRRVRLPSRTEIGDLADTFNVMADDLEKYVEQLKQAAQENHELFIGSIRTLAAAIDEKDPYTRGHSGRVSKYSVILGEAMGLPEDEVYKIQISALLHDVGKIGVDDRVLKKPGGLTPEEFDLMKQHPIKGANIIRPVAKLREMIPGIELHHEGLDGHGYPYGLKGEEIPIMARIIAVADTLDAMTTNRPYQVAMDLDTAMERIRSLQVKKFDPQVVDALFTAVEGGRLRISPQMVEV